MNLKVEEYTRFETLKRLVKPVCSNNLDNFYDVLETARVIDSKICNVACFTCYKPSPYKLKDCVFLAICDRCSN